MDAYTAALRILNFRWNGTAELRRKLLAKDFDRDEIDAALTRLAAEGWLDDERYAGAFVRTRARRNIGTGRIRRELHAAGVADDVASRALAENADEEREREQLRALADKRRRLLVRRHGEAWLATPEGRNKLIGYLLKQGYDAALVRAVTKEISVVDHDPDP